MVSETVSETVKEMGTMENNALVVAIGRPTFDVAFGADHVTAALALLERALVPGGGTDAPVTVLQPGGDERFFTDLAGLDDALDDALDPARAAAPFDVVIVLQATFSDSSLIGRIAERTDAPLLVWSFPEERTGERLRLNSLCGANLAAYLLRRSSRMHHPVEFLHLDPLDARDQAATRLSDAIRRSLTAPPPQPRESDRTPNPSAAPGTEAGRRLAAMFHGDRIGVVGDPPDGFEPCQGDPDQLEALTGIEVERVPLATLFERADTVDEETRVATERRVRSTMAVPHDVEVAGMAESIALYGGLRELAAEHGWTALTTRCWPECMTEYGGAACTPMAMLTENGLPAVCEADMFGAATSLLLHHVAGTEPFVADLVDADTADDTSVVWHCGVAPVTLAQPDVPVTAITHPNRRRALANQFGLRAGRVTLARLSQAGGRLQLVIGGGEMLDRPRPFQGTCGVLQWDEPVEDVLATVFDVGLEHHLGLVYGDHRPALAALADEWGLPVVWLGHTGQDHAGADRAGADQRSGVTV